MGGGILQLVAYGAQDVYITGNPQVTFFKLVYRRHTNFSQETIEQTFNGSADFGKKVTCLLSRNGDLIHRVWLAVGLPDIQIEPDNTTGAWREFRWLNWLGHVLIKTVEFEIGGQRIDRHYGEFMHIYAELSMKAGHQVGYANMVGNVPALTGLRRVPGVNGAGLVAGNTLTVPGTTLYIPLQFYFCRNPGLCLPLVALQYHEVKINIEFRPFEECCHINSKSGSWKPSNPTGGNPSMKTCSLLVDYIFLDSDERRRFAQSSHEYLINQIQYTGDEATSQADNKIKLSFNHPTKEIIWVSVLENNIRSVADGGPTSGRQWFNFTTKEDKSYLSGIPSDPLGGGIGYAAAGGFASDAALGALMQAQTPDGIYGAGNSNYTYNNLWAVAGSNATWQYDSGENITKTAKLQRNGHDRFAERDGRWFNLCIPYACHENIPSTGVNVYNFALRPDEHQPSGSLNFSRIDNATLHLSLKDEVKQGGCRIKIFAVSYNILRIMSGMGGLAYSN